MVADLSNPRHFRRDCRDIVRILGFGGVIPREKIEGLIRQAADLASEAGDKKNTRGFKRAMDVLMKAAQIEQREKELIPAPRLDIIDADLSGLTDEELAVLDAVRDRLNLPVQSKEAE